MIIDDRGNINDEFFKSSPSRMVVFRSARRVSMQFSSFFPVIQTHVPLFLVLLTYSSFAKREKAESRIIVDNVKSITVTLS